MSDMAALFGGMGAAQNPADRKKQYDLAKRNARKQFNWLYEKLTSLDGEQLRAVWMITTFLSMETEGADLASYYNGLIAGLIAEREKGNKGDVLLYTHDALPFELEEGDDDTPADDGVPAPQAGRGQYL